MSYERRNPAWLARMTELEADAELDEVGIPPDGLALAVPLDPREYRGVGERLPVLQLLPHLARVVDAQDDEISRTGSVERAPGGVHLVEHDLDVPHAMPLAHGLLDALQDERRRLTALASTRVAVLADDDLVEVSGRHTPERPHVIVPPVSSRGHDRHPE